MARIEHLIESSPTVIALIDSEARALSAIGKRLASDRTWYGSSDTDSEASVIRLTPTASGLWSVRVQDAVGVINVGTLQLLVEPKIPSVHLLYLFAEALQIPRLDDQEGRVATASGLWEVVARWFIRSVGAVLRRDLVRDYRSTPEVLQTVRGRLEHAATARAYYSGRIEMHCVYEDFLTDNALNRLLKAAAREVGRSAVLSAAIRRDALRMLARFDEIGDLQAADLTVVTDRRTWYYRDAVVLAKHILRSIGRTCAAGEAASWTFLIRTPELVEEAVRTILGRFFAPYSVLKTPAALTGGRMTVNPDIVFGGGSAVADVKYKLADGTWNRQDLYEVVSFACAFRVQHAALLTFAPSSLPTTMRVGVGDTNVAQISWDCGVAPDAAAQALCEDVADWLLSSGA